MSEHFELQVSEFLLKDLLADECQHAAPLAENKGLKLVLRAGDRPIWLRTDRTVRSRTSWPSSVMRPVVGS